MGLSIFSSYLLNVSFRILISILGWASFSLHACPVCGFGQDGTQTAFLVTTAILTFTPLIMGFSIFYYLKRKTRLLK